MKWCLVCLVVSLQNVYSWPVTDSSSFGPYKITWNSLETCKGPKAEDGGNVTVEVLDQASYTVGLNYSFPAKVVIDVVKITVYSMEGQTRKIMWNYKIEKPCQHFVVVELIQKSMPNGCALEKGDHYIKVSLKDATELFLGNSFFYGDFIFKVVILTKKANILCFIVRNSLSKKTS